MRFLNHLYFGPNLHFLETALGRFSSSVNLGGRHFCSAPHHKKASYGPDDKDFIAKIVSR